VSASEKLKGLGNEWRDNDIAALQDALPQIVAVVEAAHQAAVCSIGCDRCKEGASAALAALDEALS